MSRTSVRFCKTLWGVTELMGNTPDGYSKLFARIRADGFHGVETPIMLVADRPKFKAALQEHGLFYVAMINTCTFDAPSQKLDDHVRSFEQQVALALELQPVVINAHSGCDLWSFDTACAYFDRVLAVR
jgi:hypothetical protein